MNEIIEKFSRYIGTDDFWEEYDMFCENLPNENVDAEALLNFLPEIIKGGENDAAIYRIFEVVRSICQVKPDFGIEMYTKATASKNKEVFIIIPSLLAGLQTNQNFDILSEIKMLLLSEQPEIILQAFHSIVSLEKEFLKDNIEFINFINIKIAELLPNAPTNLTLECIRVLGKFSLVFPESDNKLREFSQSNIPVIQYEIANLLNRGISIAENRTLFEDLLMNLTSVKPENKGIHRFISMALRPLVTSEPELINKFISAWILNDTDNADHIMLYEDLMISIHKSNNPLFRLIISQWLNSDHVQHHRALNKLLMKVSIQSIHDIELSESYLMQLTEKDAKYIVAKIIGYVYFKEQLRTMLYSILKYRINDKETVKLITALFVEYVIFNYPSTLEYLAEIKKTANRREKSIISEIQKSATNYFENIADLNENSEFNPSDKRLDFYNSLYHRDLMSIKEKNDKDNPWFQAATTIQLRTGLGFFFKREDGSYSMPSRMTSVKYGAELPRGEFISTLQQEKIRTFYRRLKREEL